MPKPEDGKKVVSLLKKEMGLSVRQLLRKNSWALDEDLVVNALNNSLTSEQEAYMDDQLGNLDHMMDNRTPTQYGTNLILNWILEDIVAYILSRDSDIEVVLSGDDQNRDFLQATSVDPDLNVNFDGEQYYLELTAAYSDFWHGYGKIDLRGNKYPELESTDNGLLLGVDFDGQKVFVESPEQMSAKYTSNHPVWSKSAYRIDSDSVEFRSFDSLVNEFKKAAILMD